MTTNSALKLALRFTDTLIGCPIRTRPLWYRITTWESKLSSSSSCPYKQVSSILVLLFSLSFSSSFFSVTALIWKSCLWDGATLSSTHLDGWFLTSTDVGELQTEMNAWAAVKNWKLQESLLRHTFVVSALGQPLCRRRSSKAVFGFPWGPVGIWGPMVHQHLNGIWIKA